MLSFTVHKTSSPKRDHLTCFLACGQRCWDTTLWVVLAVQHFRHAAHTQCARAVTEIAPIEFRVIHIHCSWPYSWKLKWKKHVLSALFIELMLFEKGNIKNIPVACRKQIKIPRGGLIPKYWSNDRFIWWDCQFKSMILVLALFQMLLYVHWWLYNFNLYKSGAMLC